MQGKGFICLMEQLPWERLQIAIGGIAAAQAAIDWTVQYVKDRKVFGQAVGNYQNTRYTLAELQTEVQVARCLWTSAANCCCKTNSTRPRPAWPSTGARICNAR